MARPPHWSWVDVLSAQGPISAAGITIAMEMVFQESKYFQQSSLASWTALVEHSGYSHLLPRWSPDEASTDHAAWSEAPAKRLKAIRSEVSPGKVELQPIDPHRWRFHGHLALQSGLRTSLLSIAKSWRSYRSGISAWSAVTTSVFPYRDPFIITSDMVSCFSAQFQNPDTFKEYLGHVKLVLRIMGREVAMLPAQWSQLVRGLGKRRQRTQLPRLNKRQVEDLVHRAVEAGRPDFGRFFVLARGFLFRVRDELFPLQLRGRSAAPSGSFAWHSEVEIHRSKLVIHLRSRKNAPEGSSLTRSCSCRDEADVLCSYCALSGQLVDMPTHHGRAQRVWDFTWSEISSFLRAYLLSIGIKKLAWHSFRRGMAQDMLDSGSHLSKILRAGGWRSAAMLRYLSDASLDTREALEFSLNDSDSEDDS